MSAFVDGIMIFLFVMFMLFVFGGYHKTKFAQREKQSKKDELKKESEKL